MIGSHSRTTNGITGSGAGAPENRQYDASGCKNDQLGGANYVTPKQVLMAVKLVKKGESHPLGIVIDSKTPAFPPRTLGLQIVQPGQHNGRGLKQDFGWDVVYNDDLAQLWFGIGPQIDGLGHLGEAGVYYNCNKAVDFIHITGLKKLGVHAIPPLIGRGVMVDMAKHFGVATMEAGQAIGSADIKAAAKAQGVEFRDGDVVLFHTGWTDGKLKSDPKAWGSAEPGLNNEAMAYMATVNPMAVGADTYAHDLITVCGGANVFAERGERRYPIVSEEEIVAAAPDVVLLPDEPYAFGPLDVTEIARLPVPAVRAGRVHLLDGTLLTWYGPRVARALATLRVLLVPK